MLTLKKLLTLKHIHFIGIGGVSMSALAEYLFHRGIKITGSDAVSSSYTDRLRNDGVTIGIPDGAEFMKGCDLVVVNSAIREDNAELILALELGTPTEKREEILGVIFDGFKNNVAVCGMHGKTTTSAMISYCLQEIGASPTAFVGGCVSGFGSNFLDGASDICVAEACEYKASFLRLHPLVNCMLNVDSDHLDYYKNLDEITDTFKRFAQNTKSGGINIVNGDDKMLKNFSGIKFGLGAGNDFIAKNLKQQKGLYSFDVYNGKTFEMNVSLKTAGKHNVLNALCAYCVLNYFNFDKDKIKRALETFDGVERRCSIYRGEFDVIVDYAHHPREIKTLLETVSQMGYEKMRVIFQPHTYTRTKGLFEEFIDTLKADEVYLIPTFAAREEVLPGFESIDLAMAMEKAGTNVQYFENGDKLVEMIKNVSKPRDAVLLVGAGDVDKFTKKLV